MSIPTRAPRIQDWYVPRDEVVREACRRLGIYSSKSVTVAVEADDDSGGVAAAAAAATAAAAAAADKPEEPRVVGLAGPAGCGKSTAAAMVVAREDVRGYFHEGVVWLPVGGRGAKDRIPQLMLRLANLVYDTLVKKSSGSSAPPPRKPCVAADRQNGLAYILGALSHLASSGGGGSDGAQRRRFLIVADDVYEPEVLEELKGIGACVLFTTTRSPSGMRYGDPGKAGGGGVDGGAEEGSDVDLLRLDRIGDREGEVVLRRACGLDDDVELPRPAHDFIKSYGSVVMDITYVGRWGVVRGTADEKAWDTVLNRIFVEGTENGEGGAGGGEERWTRRRWHTAVLLAGLTDLGRVNDKAKDLYLYLGVLPRGLSFLVRREEGGACARDLLRVGCWRHRAGPVSSSFVSESSVFCVGRVHQVTSPSSLLLLWQERAGSLSLHAESICLYADGVYPQAYPLSKPARCFFRAHFSFLSPPLPLSRLSPSLPM